MQAALKKKAVLAAAMAFGLAGFSGLAHGSLVVGLTTSDPTVIDHVNQTVTFTIVATVTGADADTSNEGLQTAAGNILGTLTGTGPGGDFSAVTLNPTFAGASSSTGTATDLNGDGNKDVSGVSARAGSSQPGSSFTLGTVTWTAKSVPATPGQDLVSWVPKPAAGIVAGGNWTEDGAPKSNTAAGGGTYLAGSSVTLSNTPEPGSLALLGLGGFGLLLRRRRAM